MRVYISGPLHAAPDLSEARRLYESAAAACRASGWEYYLPHLSTDPVRHRELGTETVFRRDLGALATSDAVLAFIGTPSSGVGAELGIAFLTRKPVLALYRSGESPSRFLLGMLNDMRAVVCPFAGTDEAYQLIQDVLCGVGTYCSFRNFLCFRG